MRDALSRIRKPMKKMIKSDWFRRFLAGLIVGIGWILPGVSGGVIAVSLGIYSKMIDAVGGFLQAKKKNFLYLLPIGIGGCIGLFLVSNVLQWLMAEWYNDVVYFFIGLVIGGIPTLLREANSPQGFKNNTSSSLLLDFRLLCSCLLQKPQVPQMSILYSNSSHGTQSFLVQYYQLGLSSLESAHLSFCSYWDYMNLC